MKDKDDSITLLLQTGTLDPLQIVNVLKEQPLCCTSISATERPMASATPGSLEQWVWQPSKQYE